MSVGRYENTSSARRTWNRLCNAETGATLELGPGEQADVDTPDDFHDLYLKPVTAKVPRSKKEPADVPPVPPVVPEEPDTSTPPPADTSADAPKE